MVNYYKLDAIPFIFSRFKVSGVIFTGVLDENIIKIQEFCNEQDITYNCIGSNENHIEESFDANILSKLKDLDNYDAIFLNDDSNWYTVYNELNIIKKNNKEFPLVFICNNVFPYKRRDSYQNPNLIPEDFRHDFSDELIYNGIPLSDGLFHAIEENTPKNGVQTAIEDFLFENYSIGLADIRFIMGITILYPKNTISQIRWDKLRYDLKDYNIKMEDLSDTNIKNDFLTTYVSKYNISKDNLDKINEFKEEIDEKDNLIEEYENRIQLYDIEMDYKNNQIRGLDSKLSLKETEIRNAESKLYNYETEINTLNNQIDSLTENIVHDEKINDELNNQLVDASLKIDSLRSELDQRSRDFDKRELDFNNQLVDANSEIDSLRSELDQRSRDFDKRELDFNNQLVDANSEIDSLRSELDQRSRDFNNQLGDASLKIDSLMAELNQKNQDFENEQNEFEEQLNSKDFEIQSKDNQLSSKELELTNIKRLFTNQLSKLDSNEYCISCYKAEIENNHLEIQYLKNGSLTKRILNPFAYLYLLIKSNPKDLSLNYKLYKALKNSKCFDIGYYLNNNNDIRESKWCKYFSPELHYVCNGFKEQRSFNKKYFNRNSKEELLNYILTCEK